MWILRFDLFVNESVQLANFCSRTNQSSTLRACKRLADYASHNLFGAERTD